MCDLARGNASEFEASEANLCPNRRHRQRYLTSALRRGELLFPSSVGRQIPALARCG